MLRGLRSRLFQLLVTFFFHHEATENTEFFKEIILMKDGLRMPDV